jgi:hypothetical protein
LATPIHHKLFLPSHFYITSHFSHFAHSYTEDGTVFHQNTETHLPGIMT